MPASLVSADGVKAVTCDATAGEVLQVTLPAGCIAVMLYPRAAAGQVTHSDVDNTNLSADYATLPANTWTTIPLANRAAWTNGAGTGAPVIFLAHTNSSGIIEVLPVFR